MMDTHTAEVTSEALLHKDPSSRVDGLTRRAKYFMDKWRHFGLSPVTCSDTLSLQALMSVPKLLCPTLGARPTTGAGTVEVRLRHPHYLFGDTICFLLILVSRLVDR